ncbi:LysR family transcriptional regulator [Pelomonas sp. BJYL3]|uniref:LysR family transcriptional regulator n=1 Tax=Pelomonas sp. BJYL3 TaxID=2976697 RepID=UPI0022B38E5B|nr:LysR family transcriptional regulator [Pelomonas sp. BJYL3]
MKDSMPDWDDLRLLAQLARAGGLEAAAGPLGISAATLYRRLQAAERQLGVRLFERGRAGYRPTSAGQEVVALAQRMAQEVQALTHSVRSRQAWPGGLVRLSAGDTWMSGPLPALLASYQSRAQVQLQVGSANTLTDLIHGDADVALRTGGVPPESLVGRRLGWVAATVYASKKLGGVRADRLDTLPWVGVDETLAHLDSARWLEQQGLGQQVCIRTHSLVHVHQFVRQGLGLGAIPCFLGDADPGLRRVFDPPRDWRSELWLLTRPELRKVPRIRLLLDALYEGTRPLLDLIEGRGA